MPKTLRERYVLGLEALGFERDRGTRVTKYLVYRRPNGEGKLWFVGAQALRVGSASTLSRPVSKTTKEHVLTAPDRRPRVFDCCKALTMYSVWPDAVSLAKELVAREPAMAEVPFRSLLAHVSAFLKEHGEAVPKALATPEQLRGAVTAQEAEDAA